MPLDLPPLDFDAVKKPLNQASFLPSQCYGNPEYFELEQEKVLKASWLPVGRWDQVENVGDYFTLDLLGEPLIIVRSSESVVKCLANVCRHRAAAVAEGSGNTSSFRCTYHLWNYRLDGSFKGAPAMERAKEFNVDTCGLHEFPLTQWQGFLFVNLSRSAPPMEPELTDLEKELAPYQLSSLHRLEPIVYDCPWDWKISTENTLESYHYMGLHANSIGPLYQTLSFGAEQDALLDQMEENPYLNGTGPAYSLGFQFTKENSQPLTIPGASGKELPDDYKNRMTAMNIFPYTSVLITPAITYWPHFIVESANSHRLEYIPLINPTIADAPEMDSVRDYFRSLLKTIHDEDMPALKQVAKGLQTSHHQAGRLSHLEVSIWQFHNWMVHKLESGQR